LSVIYCLLGFPWQEALSNHGKPSQTQLPLIYSFWL
jgi:hypothetical protein